MMFDEISAALSKKRNTTYSTKMKIELGKHQMELLKQESNPNPEEHDFSVNSGYFGRFLGTDVFLLDTEDALNVLDFDDDTNVYLYKNTMSKDSLGDRMKEYENVERRYLMRRVPTIIRIDGKAFHSFTKGFQRPYDKVFIETMWDTAKELCKQIQGCKLAYVQSDEISLLLTDDETITTDAWFDKNIQKMTSVAASIATMAFNKSFRYNVNKMVDMFDKDLLNIYANKEDCATFDSRVFNIPKEEVCNVFIWRQQDAVRNSIQMLAQSHFSHKQLQKKNCKELQEMLWQEKGVNWNDLEVWKKRGACVIKKSLTINGAIRNHWEVDYTIPTFTENRNYIEQYIIR